jgi:hypothetical protein
MPQVIKTAAGELLTEEDLEALADEAERGYDPTTWRNVRVGRPALGNDRGPSPRIQIRVDAELATALKACARSENRSVSAIARNALNDYVARAG